MCMIADGMCCVRASFTSSCLEMMRFMQVCESLGYKRTRKALSHATASVMQSETRKADWFVIRARALYQIITNTKYCYSMSVSSAADGDDDDNAAVLPEHLLRVLKNGWYLQDK